MCQAFCVGYFFSLSISPILQKRYWSTEVDVTFKVTSQFKELGSESGLPGARTNAASPPPPHSLCLITVFLIMKVSIIFHQEWLATSLCKLLYSPYSLWQVPCLKNVSSYIKTAKGFKAGKARKTPISPWKPSGAFINSTAILSTRDLD